MKKFLITTLEVVGMCVGFCCWAALVAGNDDGSYSSELNDDFSYLEDDDYYYSYDY